MSTLNCSFCGMGQRVVEKLIAGPSVYICNRCAEEFDRSGDAPAAWSHTEHPSSRCSFCNKSRADVAQMFARSASLICNQCVEIAQEIFWEDRVPPPTMMRRLLGWPSRALSRCVKLFFPASLPARGETQRKRFRFGDGPFNPGHEQP